MSNSNINELKNSVGGFCAGNISVTLEGDSIISLFNNFEHYRDPEECMPTQEDWGIFSDSLNKIGVLKWKRKYDNLEIEDGIQWELTLCVDSKKKKCFGSNEYPVGFDQFLLVVNQLVKSDVFQERYERDI